MTPSPCQAAYLKAIYRQYSRYHLARKLGITEKELDGMLRYLKLRKKIDLTPEQEEYIRLNFLKLKHAVIANKLGIDVGAVQRYCFKNNLRKTGKNKYSAGPVAANKVQGEYSSGYEATVNKYLNKEI